MRPASYDSRPDTFFDNWCKVVAVMAVIILVGTQLMAAKPDPALFFVMIPMFAIPVAFLSAVLVWVWDTIKLIFE